MYMTYYVYYVKSVFSAISKSVMALCLKYGHAKTLNICFVKMGSLKVCLASELCLKSVGVCFLPLMVDTLLYFSLSLNGWRRTPCFAW